MVAFDNSQGAVRSSGVVDPRRGTNPDGRDKGTVRVVI